eukprot:COSAG02_NODE_7808_length_2837_cov_3.525201_4_plen_60_part_01
MNTICRQRRHEKVLHCSIGSSGASSVEAGTLNARDTVVVLDYNDSISGFHCDHLHWSASV